MSNGNRHGTIASCFRFMLSFGVNGALKSLFRCSKPRNDNLRRIMTKLLQCLDESLYVSLICVIKASTMLHGLLRLHFQQFLQEQLQSAPLDAQAVPPGRFEDRQLGLFALSQVGLHPRLQTLSESVPFFVRNVTRFLQRQWITAVHTPTSLDPSGHSSETQADFRSFWYNKRRGNIGRKKVSLKDIRRHRSSCGKARRCHHRHYTGHKMGILCTPFRSKCS
jgi:hypothetical protein